MTGLVYAVRSIWAGIDTGKSFSDERVWSAQLIKSPYGPALIASSFSMAFLALLLAWVLVRYEFPGRRILRRFGGFCPFALPTAVARYPLATLYAQKMAGTDKYLKHRH